MSKIAISTVLIVLWVACACAQTPTTDNTKFEVYAGYSANNLTSGNPEGAVDLNSNSTPTYRGWNASATYNVNRYFGIKADVSGHYDKITLLQAPLRISANSSLYNVLGGIQVKDNKRTKRFSPFAHALFGVATSKTTLNSSICTALPNCTNSNTGFAMAFGGGLDLRVKKNLSIRLIEAEYNPIFLGGIRQNNIRLGFGIVIH